MATLVGEAALRLEPVARELIVVRPIGFNRDIAMALLPTMAAREVAVSSIATIYSIDSPDEAASASKLQDKLRHGWPLPTALAFLAWFVFAPQCISTIAVTRRETNGWKWPAFMVGYLFAAAYIMAGITYWLAVFAGLRGVWFLTVICGLFAVLNLGVLWTTRGPRGAVEQPATPGRAAPPVPPR